ncbi:protein of unknown function DUF1419 (plasmid) [Rhizobium leguminosarum bv. trifolii WSM2304]|uniref:DUF1419 domain-containing protein n=1 Tax=Rhizobium leguminosarum bv. trifolii (strain WSM2304) TaxID=395492 RepID=A0ABF7QZF7_RHILW|nr:DUF1419 domain-containing protein [Rhizobium leguminosarum]ACI59561.1 protein of unknown function DUF1419 [Rhizobium leguminosarum bv. trifolii WSM2304]
MSHLQNLTCQPRKVLEGVATRQQMYALFNRHSQAPSDEQRATGARYSGEWFEVSEGDHDRMFEILPPLFYRGDLFAMREFLAARVTSVFFALRLNGGLRHFHGYCDLAEPSSIDRMRAAIIARESAPSRSMTRAEKLDYIWSTTGPEYRAYADFRSTPAFLGRLIVVVYSAADGKIWKLLDDLTDLEIAAKLPVQFRHLPDIAAA